MFDEVHREYMVISWKPPLDSGGVDVSNYIIEMRDVNRDTWTTVTSATTKTTCKVRPYGLLNRFNQLVGSCDILQHSEQFNLFGHLFLHGAGMLEFRGN